MSNLFACGSFLIAGDLPQYKDILKDKENALTVKVGDPEDLFLALVWVHENHSLRKDAARLNRKYVSEHADHRVQADLINQIYHQLLAKEDN